MNLPIDIKNKNILICAIGGGFDIFGAIPIAWELSILNKVVLSSFNLNKNIQPIYDYKGGFPVPYFPEGILPQPFDHQLNIIGKTGCVPLLKYYQELCDRNRIEHIIMVDCGIDSLMVGNEARKGTITEEYVNFAALRQIDIPKTHVCFGFGCESEEGISHYRVLENIASLIKKDGFEGSCSLTKDLMGYYHYKECYNNIANFPDHKRSHIHPRIIDAIEGEFGDITNDEQTLMSTGGKTFINPLMGMYWFFDGDVVIDSIPIIPQLFQHTHFVQSLSLINQLPEERDFQQIPI
jgi:hypothetical protein